MGNNQPRSFKFYRENEKQVMESLGLKPTKNSGSTWIEKEDGQNDFVICQLKSTDAQSIKINQKDLKILEYNASVANKIPMFAIQFLNTGEVWIMVKPIELANISQYIKTGHCVIETEQFVSCDKDDKENENERKKIENDLESRMQYFEECRKKYDKTKTAK